MNEALVLMLALIWAIVLLPGALRSRRTSAHATVGGFHNAMAVLKKTPDGRSVMVPEDAGRIVSRSAPGERPHPRPHASTPRSEDPRIARRRALFTRLLVTVGVTFLAGLVLGGFAWTLFTVATATLAGYAALLRRYKIRQDEVREVVRELRGENVAPSQRQVEQLPIAVGASGPQVATRPDDPWQPMSGVRIRRWDAE